MGIIVLFCWGEGGRIEGNGVSSFEGGCSLPFILWEHGSHPILWGICLEVKGFIKVGLLQDWFANHFVLEGFKCLLLSVLPFLGYHLLCEIEEGSGDLGVPLYKVPVVSYEPKEFVLTHYGVRPSPQLCPPLIVPSVPPFCNLHSQEVKVTLFKCTLFWV